jgi:hypothetical protein
MRSIDDTTMQSVLFIQDFDSSLRNNYAHLTAVCSKSMHAVCWNTQRGHNRRTSNILKDY